MRTVLVSLLLAVGLTAFAQPYAWRAYVDSVQRVWTGPESILTDLEREGVRGVPYFPYDSAARVTARYVSLGAARPIAIPSSTGTDHVYLPLARLHFRIGAEDAALTVYRGLNAWSEEDHYFVMFYDATNGVETYGGGRYLELDDIRDDNAEVTVDFNYSYHPYCAYSDRYSCPIPPPENRLAGEVRAGVRLAEGDHQCVGRGYCYWCSA